RIELVSSTSAKGSSRRTSRNPTRPRTLPPSRQASPTSLSRAPRARAAAIRDAAGPEIPSPLAGRDPRGAESGDPLARAPLRGEGGAHEDAGEGGELHRRIPSLEVVRRVRFRIPLPLGAGERVREGLAALERAQDGVGRGVQDSLDARHRGAAQTVARE